MGKSKFKYDLPFFFSFGLKFNYTWNIHFALGQKNKIYTSERVQWQQSEPHVANLLQRSTCGLMRLFAPGRHNSCSNFREILLFLKMFQSTVKSSIK